MISNEVEEDDFAGKNETSVVIEVPRSVLNIDSGAEVGPETRRIGS